MRAGSVAKLADELQRVEPDARQVRYGSHIVWVWETVVPAFTFTSVLLIQPTARAIELTARQGFSKKLAEKLLNLIAPWDGFEHDARTITVLPWPKSRNPFDQVVIVPPRIARRFSHASEILPLACFWAFPTYSGEFTSGQDEWDLDATIRRGGEVHVVEWDREPAPHVKYQLLDAWPGGMLAKRRKLLRLPFRIVSTYMWELPIEKVRVRLQDICGREVVVVRQANGLLFSGEILKTAWRANTPEEANRFLMAFLRGALIGGDEGD